MGGAAIQRLWLSMPRDARLPTTWSQPRSHESSPSKLGLTSSKLTNCTPGKVVSYQSCEFSCQQGMGNTSSSNKISPQDRFVQLKPEEQLADRPRAILDLKVQRDKIHQYQKRLSSTTDREVRIARECLKSGQKSKALLALRRKKYQESLLEKTDLQLEQLQKLISDVEFATVQKDVMFGIQQGTAVLKQIHSEMGGIEKVEKLLGENEEARAYEREIGDLLAGQLSNHDEDEVEDELSSLERELQFEGVHEPLPDVPDKVPEREEGLKGQTRSSTRQRQELLPA